MTVNIRDEYTKFSRILNEFPRDTAEYMKDCVWVANSNGENGVKGFPAHGFELSVCGLSNTEAYFHMTYVKESLGVDIILNPSQKSTKLSFDGFGDMDRKVIVFNVKDGIDEFAEFIDDFAKYLPKDGEAKIAEAIRVARKHGYLVFEAKDSEAKIDEAIRVARKHGYLVFEAKEKKCHE